MTITAWSWMRRRGPRALARRWPTIVVGAGAVAFFVIMAWFALRAHWGLRTQMEDLGNAVQSIWQITQGNLAMTMSNDLDGVMRSRLAEHFNVIYYFFAPFYALWPRPELLLVTMPLAGAAGGLGLYAVARHQLNDHWMALVAPVVFWLHPMVQDAILFDFKVLPFAVAFIVWMIWAFETDRPRAGWIFCALALLCQEDVALIVALHGIGLALGARRRLGLQILVLSVAYLVVTMGLIVPVLNAGRFTTKMYGEGNRFGWLLTDPLAGAAHLFEPTRLRTPLYVLLTGAVLCLRQWRILLMAVPATLAAMLGENIWTSRITGTYYLIVPAAVIVLACVKTAATTRQRRLPLLYLGGVTLVLTSCLSPLPYGVGSDWSNHSVADLEALKRVSQLIPPHAALMVQNNLGAHFANRRDIARLGRRESTAEYVLLHIRHPGGSNFGLFVRQAYQWILAVPDRDPLRFARLTLASPRWSLAYQRDGYYLFKRGADRPSERQLAIWRADQAAFFSQVRESELRRLSWAWLLNGRVTWDVFL